MTNTRVSILLINHVSEVGGAEAGLLDIVRSVDRNRYDFIAVLPEAGSLSAALDKLNVPAVFMPLRRFRKTLNPLSLVSYYMNVRRIVPSLVELIRGRGIDIVHSNSNTAHIYGAMAARQAGTRCLLHSRDLVPLGLLGKWLCDSSTKVACISEAVRRHLSRYCADGGKLARLYNGIDTDFFSPEAGPRPYVDPQAARDNPLVITNIGQLVPWKKQDIFIEAAAMIVRQMPEVTFRLVGDELFGRGSRFKQSLLHMAERKGLAGALSFAGHLSDVRPVLRETDVLVHAADREPFGRALAEAMSMETAVVAVNSCGPAELVRDGIDGILVEKADPVQLSSAAIRLCRDASLRQRLARSARRRIIDSFNIRTFGSGMAELYESTMGTTASAAQCLDNHA
ncbi:MAG: hypothetical protein C0404_08040 [Verrucomicrobia bacterium]|nr:hypothetical protein [Verrucomicrobiota bacterium]